MRRGTALYNRRHAVCVVPRRQVPPQVEGFELVPGAVACSRRRVVGECCRAGSCWDRGGRVGEDTTVIVREEVVLSRMFLSR
mmetsp:Transcript_35225/g.40061  ORF Transcript_35225/g.40061 Transcript_35225/m.40061 type:complete len:82 (+) Transcript_35225:371-616(+)